MSKKLFHIVFVAFMLVALIGQGFANTLMTCEMNMEGHNPTSVLQDAADNDPHAGHGTNEHRDMDHSSMNHSSMSHLDAMSVEGSGSMPHQDCCGQDCFCPTSACASVTILVTQEANDTLPYITELALQLDMALPATRANTLFRPPIFA